MYETGARLPLIASRTGGTPEIIQDGVNGLLFDHEDYETLKRLTCRLLDHPEEREALGRRAFEIVQQHFTDQPVRELERFYAETLAEAGAPSAGREQAADLSGADFK